MKKIIVIFFIAALLAASLFQDYKRGVEISNLKQANDSISKVNDLLENKFFQYVSFRDLLAYTESRNNHLIVNRIGAIGKYQFMENTLKYLNIPLDSFKNNEFIQDIVFNQWMDSATNKLYEKQLTQYIGSYIDTIPITKSGLLAGYHLGGIGGVNKLLTSYKDYKDINGTKVSDYIYKFQFDF